MPPLFCWWSFCNQLVPEHVIYKKNWVYVNLDRITKSCPWPTFKVQWWWEKDVFLLGNFFVSILWIVFWILPRSSQSIKNTPDSFLFRWSDLTWTAGQNLGTFLEVNNKSFSPTFIFFNEKNLKRFGWFLTQKRTLKIGIVLYLTFDTKSN